MATEAIRRVDVVDSSRTVILQKLLADPESTGPRRRAFTP
ncbi:hypothetical protein SSCG_06126 [Streptomyces clavuligerus]|nr:hypothetical protein SSCG_06126 [Streptomyces clavuligerus]